MTTNRKLHLNAFLMNVGHHEAAWRHPRTNPGAVGALAHFAHLAQEAERGKLDSVFFADGLALWPNVRHNSTSGVEPLTLLGALAAVTQRIGLIATVSTTYNAPFHVARKFASIDHLSGGRAGWNIVTSSREEEARNFGSDPHPEHGERYQRADEFLDVVTKLWDSWEDDALVYDRASGVYADTDRVHAIDHAGRWFSVRGPLNLPRPPQGWPVLVQAGSSEDGKHFAAAHAEAIFTAQQTLAEGKAFYADVKARVAAAGRDPDDVKILPGICPFLGRTEAAARELAAEFDDLIVPAYGLQQLSSMLEVDLSGYPLDGPLPELGTEADIKGGRSRFALVTDLARRENLTIRQLLARLAGGRGHRVIAGTPVQVADSIEEWFRNGAADGFNVMPPYLPGGLTDFVDQVVPELVRRGLFRSEYTGTTLRDHYGLRRPASRTATVTAEATVPR